MSTVGHGVQAPVKESAVTSNPGVPSPLDFAVALDSLHSSSSEPLRTGLVAFAVKVTALLSVWIVCTTDSHPSWLKLPGVPIKTKQRSIGLAEAEVAPENAIAAVAPTAARPSILTNLTCSPLFAPTAKGRGNT